MSRLVLDAGAFIAFERGDPSIRARLSAAQQLGSEIATTSPVIAQVWRDGRRQAVLARLVAAVRIEAPDDQAARAAGELLARTRSDDVVDALVVGLLRDGDVVITSDVADIRALLSAAGTRATIMRV